MRRVVAIGIGHKRTERCADRYGFAGRLRIADRVGYAGIFFRLRLARGVRVTVSIRIADARAGADRLAGRMGRSGPADRRRARRLAGGPGEIASFETLRSSG